MRKEVVKVGYIAANSNYKGVINNLKCRDMKEITYSKPQKRDSSLEGKKYNVLGNKLYTDISKVLGVEINKCGYIS